MTIRAYLHHTPQIDSSVYVDDSATVIGQVVLSTDSSVWCGAVVRGDVNHIHIGQRSNVQDLAMLHVSHKTMPSPKVRRSSLAMTLPLDTWQCCTAAALATACWWAWAALFWTMR